MNSPNLSNNSTLTFSVALLMFTPVKMPLRIEFKSVYRIAFLMNVNSTATLSIALRQYST